MWMQVSENSLPFFYSNKADQIITAKCLQESSQDSISYVSAIG